MSVQFGRWNFDGQSSEPEYVEKVSAILAPYGPDGNGKYSKAGVTILYHAFHTTKESRREVQPHVVPSGAALTWDGVLDNRKELIGELSGSLPADSTDVAIVAAAYEKWGGKCLTKLIGDWALSIWNPADRSVLLARDPIGTRHLYYTFENDYVAWCTILDPLVQLAGKTFEICREYIAGWFVPPVFTAPHLTPYVGVHDVPPSSFVQLRQGKRNTVAKYWDFDPGKKIRYRTDTEYEEHFRAVFAQAVQRKLRSDRPVLAELSGGMDSSAIVSMADALLAAGRGDCPRVDTISWYNDTYDHIEPDSNDLHWISKVEEKRGRVGCHINFRELKAKEGERPRVPFSSLFGNDRLASTPMPNNVPPIEFFKQYKASVDLQGHRIILSGIGGDETTGAGLPTPTIEIQDHLARARFLTLIRRLNAWASRMKSPRLPLLWEAMREFLYVPLVDVCEAALKTPWLSPAFVRQYRSVFRGYPSRIKLFGPLPSFQEHMDRLRHNRRFFGVRSSPGPELLAAVRYPFTDRDFREFAYAIPREQVVGVGKRRYLLKRALAGIVPDEVLNRRRKAFVPPQAPSGSITKNSNTWPSPEEIGTILLASSAGIVDRDRFLEALENARRNAPIPAQELEHTLTLEFWLRHLAALGVLNRPAQSRGSGYSSAFERRQNSFPVPPLAAGERPKLVANQRVSAS